MAKTFVQTNDIVFEAKLVLAYLEVGWKMKLVYQYLPFINYFLKKIKTIGSKEVYLV